MDRLFLRFHFLTINCNLPDFSSGLVVAYFAGSWLLLAKIKEKEGENVATGKEVVNATFSIFCAKKCFLGLLDLFCCSTLIGHWENRDAFL